MQDMQYRALTETPKDFLNNLGSALNSPNPLTTKYVRQIVLKTVDTLKT